MAIVGCKCKPNKVSGKKKFDRVDEEKGKNVTDKKDENVIYLKLISDKQALKGSDKIFKLFLINNVESSVDLSCYKLKITLQEEGSGSELSYIDAQGISQTTRGIEESLTHFTMHQCLKQNDPTLFLPFIIQSTTQVVRVIITMELYHNNLKSKIQTVVISWEKSPITDEMIKIAKSGGETFLADVLKKLQKYEQIDINEIDPSRKGRNLTALHQAAQLGNIAILDAIIEWGGQLNAMDESGFTPLHWAAVRGNTAATLKLIEQGAEVDAKSVFGHTPLALAVCSVFPNQIEVVEKLIEKGADVSITDEKGNTPLHLAAKYGHTQLALKLIEKGAKVDTQNNEGNTPLHLAIEFGYIDTTLKLIEQGAQLNIQNDEGNTPLHLASRKGHSKIIIKLIEQGAVKTMKNRYGRTALSLAKAEEIRKLLR